MLDALWEHLRMEQHDDAEARIRELERPLADVARTSELGTQPQGFEAGYYPPPPPTASSPLPPPPPAYGAPWSPPATPPSKTFPWGLTIALVVVGLVVAGGAIAFFGAFVWLRGSSTDGSGVFGGGGSLGASSTTRPRTSSTTRPSTPVTAAPSSRPTATSSPPASTGPGERISVSGISQSRTIDCNACIVDVSGSSNAVTVTGHSVELIVSGITNVVIVDSADTIEVSGIENRVTYHSGAPQVDNGGISNIVEQG